MAGTMKVRRSFLERRIFYICPKCGKPIKSRKIRHANACILCGQKLDWTDCENVQSLYISVQDSGEAAYWAEAYASCTGENYGIDIDEWRLSLRKFPMLLYFPFMNPKDYGRFMRKASKEAAFVTEFN